MELPSRKDNDRFVPRGRYLRLTESLRAASGNARLPILIVSTFDRRTRMLPFIEFDRWLVPAGPRAISAALADAGFRNQRLVNQAWTPNVRASWARVGGALPELLLISSMEIHSAPAHRLIRDAHRLGAQRPLIVVGGPKATYQPWTFLGTGDQNLAADVVCTGEEYVLLELMERLYESKRRGEPLRAAFERCRVRGYLDDVAGLLYDRGDGGGGRELVDTGIQRLVQDYDELPGTVEGFRFLEPPHSRRGLCRQPLRLRDIRRHCRVVSLLTTRGCRFRCGYCPIPAYNHFTFRTRSPRRLVEDITQVRRELGIHFFFGTDDNFFNDRTFVTETFEALARASFAKDDIGKPVRFGTEATEADVHRHRDLLPLCYRGGLRMVWIGVEDLTATLVKKGQSFSKTTELFGELRRNRIQPMVMLMHHEGQPLLSRGSQAGLLNQIEFVRRAGAASVQVTVLIPMSGSREYDAVMRSGIILKTLGATRLEDCHLDGNHVISKGAEAPWKLQRNLLLAYALFYNPISLLRLLLKRGWKWSDLFMQLWGMWGLLLTSCRLVPWMLRLWRNIPAHRYSVHEDVPHPPWPIVSPGDEPQAYPLDKSTSSSTGVDDQVQAVPVGGGPSLRGY